MEREIYRDLKDFKPHFNLLWDKYDEQKKFEHLLFLWFKIDGDDDSQFRTFISYHLKNSNKTYNCLKKCRWLKLITYNEDDLKNNKYMKNFYKFF